MGSDLLKSFAAFAAERGQTHVVSQTAIDWAALGPTVAQRDARLRAVCRFVRHVQVEDVGHKLPPANHSARAIGAARRTSTRETRSVASSKLRCGFGRLADCVRWPSLPRRPFG